MNPAKAELLQLVEQLSDDEAKVALEYVKAVRDDKRVKILARVAGKPGLRLPAPGAHHQFRRDPLPSDGGKTASGILIEDRR